MKKLVIFVLALVALAVKPVHADTSTTTVVSNVWQDIKSSSTMHILDNGTPALFYDFKNHQSFSGATTEIYKYRHFSTDFGLIKNVDSSGKLLPIIGGNIHLGSFLNRFEPINHAVTQLGLNQGLLQYFVVGGWAGHDFADPMREIHYGLYTGFRIEIK